MQVSGTFTLSTQTEEPGFLLSLQSAYPWPIILMLNFFTVLARQCAMDLWYETQL